MCTIFNDIGNCDLFDKMMSSMYLLLTGGVLFLRLFQLILDSGKNENSIIRC